MKLEVNGAENLAREEREEYVRSLERTAKAQAWAEAVGQTAMWLSLAAVLCTCVVYG